MNSINCIIQILEISKIKLYDNNIPMVVFRSQLPYARNKVDSTIIIKSVIWGNLAYDFVKYYCVNDFVLIEGYTSIVLDSIFNQIEIKLTITKLYPFLFKMENLHRKFI